MDHTAKTLDWKQYLDTASQAVSEGVVMLKNKNHALPLQSSQEIAVFGRIQLHYYKSGTGSGGMVNVSRVTSILDGLLEAGVSVNQELLDVYKKWDSEHPFDVGAGWGMEPWSQEEMPVEDTLAARIAKSCKTAIVILGRTAGEEQDNSLREGSYLLTDTENTLLATVRRHFSKMIVLLNVGNIIDMNALLSHNPDSILYVWQGGMTGGTGTAAVLTGAVSPSGKLTDTIARHVSDYPSDPHFGDPSRNVYAEDIYVGYRYFETFAPDAVLYPFGFGLSYTTFGTETTAVQETTEGWNFTVSVTNTGTYSGREVVQIYCEAPQGVLGKPVRVLCAYAKTKTLTPGQTQILSIPVMRSTIASYDDSGATGHPQTFLLEAGDYRFYVGTDVRSASAVYTWTPDALLVLSCHAQALAPVEPFRRLRPLAPAGETADSAITFPYTKGQEDVPLSAVDEKARRLQQLPTELPFTGDRGIRLSDVRHGTHTMEDFIAQLSDEDLSCIVRGEGMNSPKVTAGTAAAFGGVSDTLASYGIPCACCDDGPSGMRLDSGAKAFSLPNGTMLACTFNPALITDLFALTGLEMVANRVDCLLGPGMNIHRHPLNGRNFEYFSEDPFLTGTIAAAQLQGLHRAGAEGTVKHFCGNNQETHRHDVNAVISERALREIYLKGFEIAVREGNARSVMTTYAPVNGLWTAASYDLTTQILRRDWGFSGFVMTDWWARVNRRGGAPDTRDLAAMAIAQNDVYMVCADSTRNDDNLLSSLRDGSLSRGELQRNAANICRFLMDTHAMSRLCGKPCEITILNRPKDDSDVDETDVVFYPLSREQELIIPLEDICTRKGTNFSFALDMQTLGYYRMCITASSTLSDTAQIPVTLFSLGTAYGTFTWNGTGGRPVTFEREIPLFSRYTTMRLYFAQSGLTMHDIRFQFITDEF